MCKKYCDDNSGKDGNGGNSFWGAIFGAIAGAISGAVAGFAAAGYSALVGSAG